MRRRRVLSRPATTYRDYYAAGAAVNNGSGALLIPYQYDSEAKVDTTVTNPKDIKVVIMDGGGNDVLIDQRSCLSDANAAALMADTACQTAVMNTGAAMEKLWKEMVTDGVKQLVYYFYPHLDTAGGGYLTTPAPGVNLSMTSAPRTTRSSAAARPSPRRRRTTRARATGWACSARTSTRALRTRGTRSTGSWPTRFTRTRWGPRSSPISPGPRWWPTASRSEPSIGRRAHATGRGAGATAPCSSVSS